MLYPIMYCVLWNGIVTIIKVTKPKPIASIWNLKHTGFVKKHFRTSHLVVHEMVSEMGDYMYMYWPFYVVIIMIVPSFWCYHTYCNYYTLYELDVNPSLIWVIETLKCNYHLLSTYFTMWNFWFSGPWKDCHTGSQCVLLKVCYFPSPITVKLKKIPQSIL